MIKINHNYGPNVVILQQFEYTFRQKKYQKLSDLTLCVCVYT